MPHAPIDRILHAARLHGCVPVRLTPRQSLLDRHAIADSLYIALSGRLRASLSFEGTDLTLAIFRAGDTFTSMESFMLRAPSEYAIEAIDLVEIMAVPRTVLEDLLREDPSLAMDLLAHHRLWLAGMTRRIMDLLMATPLERYLRFEREHPDLMEQLPLYMVASMIGVKPESLSRIRRRLASRPPPSRSRVRPGSPEGA